MEEVPLHNINYDRMKTHSHHQRKIKMEQQQQHTKNEENLLQHKSKESKVK